MKKLVYFLVFVLILVAITPWVMGLYFKQQFTNFINATNQFSKSKINIVEYHVGWLNSQAKLHCSADMGKGSPPLELTINENITHGPFIFDKAHHHFVIAMAIIDIALHLPDDIESVIYGKQRPSSVLQATTIAQFDGVWLTHAQTPPINISMPDYGSLSWQGLSGDSKMVVNGYTFKSVETTILIGAFLAKSLDGQNTQVTIQPMTLTYHGEFKSNGLWSDDSQIALPRITATNIMGNNINIENLKLNTNHGVTSNSAYSLTEKLSFNKFVLSSLDITPIAPGSWSFSINNLNANGITNLVNLSDSDYETLALTLASKIITPATTINSDVALTTPQGQLTMTGSLSELNPAAANPEEALKTSKVNVAIRIAIPLANKLAEYYSGVSSTTPPAAGRSSGTAPGVSFDPSKSNLQMSQADVDLFDQKVADLMKQGKLTLSTSMQIMSLSGQNLTPDQFNLGLAAVKLPAEVATQIGQIYAQILIDEQTKKSPTSPSNPNGNPAAMIDQWVSQGYLIKDNNDYTTLITQEKGVININGKPLPN